MYMTDNEHFWLFPTVISRFKLDHNFEDVAKVIENEEPGVNFLIKNGNRSSSSIFLNKIPNLKNAVQKYVDQYTSYLGLVDCDISYSWCNIYNINGAIKPHRHELSVISGVLYVRAEEHAGEIVFDNPLNMFRVNEISKEKTEYNTHNFKISVSTGDLILFPSWIMHYSENNFSNARYLISFDTGIRNYGLVS